MSSGYYEAHRPTKTEILEQRVSELEEELARLKVSSKEPELVPWDASMGEHYYITNMVGVCGTSKGEYHRSCHPLCFKTKEDAEQMRDYLKVIYKLRMQTKGFVPDWDDIRQNKWCIFYHCEHNVMRTAAVQFCNDGGVVFRTEEDAQAAADSLTLEEIETFKKGWPVPELVEKPK